MIKINCLKGLPIEYETFLIEKYNSFITTCRYIEIYCFSFDIYYMLVYENENLIDILVFGNKGNTTTCFNSLVNIDENIIDQFTIKIFEIYPDIKKIKIDASYKKYDIKKSVLCFISDNHILNLPSTMNEYYMKLGSSTRQNVKNRKIRLIRDYPEVNFNTKYGDEIDEIIIDKIIQLHVNRMKQLGKVSGIDTIYKNNIFKYSKHYGCVSYIEIKDEIIAGSINSILNKGIFGHVTAFDSNFSKYNVGEICAFYLIQTSIEKGLTTFNFLWGGGDLKKRLLAKPHLLFSYFIYRSYSFDYILKNINMMFSKIIMSFKLSSYSKPLRNTMRFFRRAKLISN